MARATSRLVGSLASCEAAAAQAARRGYQGGRASRWTGS